MKLVVKMALVVAFAVPLKSLADDPKSGAPTRPQLSGRTLFLKNCAHCHADDATGDEGPDLHGLSRSDEWIARRIRNGVKGKMTAFGVKFSQADIDALIGYLRTLK